jgi:AcrR family transcriptional regulator
MPRPRSEDRRTATLAAAARVIAVQGLAAPTATIAREADVSNGSLFVYFDTKAALLNELYVTLKTEMAAASGDLPAEREPREQVRHMWTQWLRWATANPEKRRAPAPCAAPWDTASFARARAAARTGACTGKWATCSWSQPSARRGNPAHEDSTGPCSARSRAWRR